MADLLDTNVVLRYLVEDPETTDSRFSGVVTFFEKLERGERTALLTPLVLFQCDQGLGKLGVNLLPVE